MNIKWGLLGWSKQVNIWILISKYMNIVYLFVCMVQTNRYQWVNIWILNEAKLDIVNKLNTWTSISKYLVYYITVLIAVHFITLIERNIYFWEIHINMINVCCTVKLYKFKIKAKIDSQVKGYNTVNQ